MLSLLTHTVLGVSAGFLVWFASYCFNRFCTVAKTVIDVTTHVAMYTEDKFGTDSHKILVSGSFLHDDNLPLRTSQPLPRERRHRSCSLHPQLHCSSIIGFSACGVPVSVDATAGGSSDVHRQSRRSSFSDTNLPSEDAPTHIQAEASTSSAGDDGGSASSTTDVSSTEPPSEVRDVQDDDQERRLERGEESQDEPIQDRSQGLQDRLHRPYGDTALPFKARGAQVHGGTRTPTKLVKPTFFTSKIY